MLDHSRAQISVRTRTLATSTMQNRHRSSASRNPWALGHPVRRKYRELATVDCVSRDLNTVTVISGLLVFVRLFGLRTP
jgi:hypothetical protein